MGWGTDNVPVDATQLTALRSNRRGQGTQHVMKMLRHMWVGWGWGGALINSCWCYATHSSTQQPQGTRYATCDEDATPHVGWVGMGWGGALITFLLMLRNSAVVWLLEDSQKIAVSNLRTRGKLDRRVDQRLLNQIKAFMYRHNSGHNLWKELGKLAKKSRRWTTCKGELKNELCWNRLVEPMWLNLANRRKKTIILLRRVENRWTLHTKRTFGSWPQWKYDLTFLLRFYKTLQIPWFCERSIMKNPWITPGR